MPTRPATAPFRMPMWAWISAILLIAWIIGKIVRGLP
jgi:hypothetical protein